MELPILIYNPIFISFLILSHFKDARMLNYFTNLNKTLELQMPLSAGTYSFYPVTDIPIQVNCQKSLTPYWYGFRKNASEDLGDVLM